MSREILSAIKLEDAFFCLDCEVVTNCWDVCPACGNRRLWSLQNWLGRVGDEGNSKYRKPTIEGFQPANQEIAVNRAASLALSFQAKRPRIPFNKECGQMAYIRVVYRREKYGFDYVSSRRLDSLITGDEITHFYRPVEKKWINIRLDPVRGSGGLYQGPERRDIIIRPEGAEKIGKDERNRPLHWLKGLWRDIGKSQSS